MKYAAKQGIFYYINYQCLDAKNKIIKDLVFSKYRKNCPLLNIRPNFALDTVYQATKLLTTAKQEKGWDKRNITGYDSLHMPSYKYRFRLYLVKDKIAL